jgi:transcriptional regulator with XRE-family HTH domain
MGTPTVPASFAGLLQRYRRVAGLTQEELAERARLSVRGISNLERGVRRLPQRSTVTLLAEALALSGVERGAFEAAARGLKAPPDSRSPEAPLASSRIDGPPLVGRKEEMALVARHLRGDGPPVLLLAGSPASANHGYFGRRGTRRYGRAGE